MTPVPTLFRVIAIAALAWNLIGIAMFFLQTGMSAAQIAQLPPAQQAVYAAMPAWLSIFYAIAVFGGALGSLALLLRRRWALPLLAISLAAVLVQTIALYALTPAWQASGVGGLPMTLLIVGIAAFLLWYARLASKRGWLR
ncbi:hypothetical protein FZO89_12615 [Luteimonas viscosa]|uniref:Sugar transporter n=1 Tax=Luteimonas viscosa TaxID=1132694 RepID=A0A5D4XSI1_9GAMM|nr:hypothetical protein [Luteimonas viscosa]TYT27034.1 hypothetical protein FZO89_12615 [Luteimonas viscosa]